ncbi:MAG: formate hydrogenlyase [Rhodoferax sp.]|nr:formate hydrogenlyase [Rhodoferax sp.]OIP21225.1 MAG: formate hydrogenlyase [Comamonadaceae bacterium CG2_30_60_41]PIW10722.1 MAG: formate hydrogenlyase [Comamonadaceae bacterium CG17_big_fil_post_rev_8_21_14_2_50_60_13]PIY23478.1 MAG: formate hydrogenlyase [Comamonadaceae bacterium CG_4_10_14_3_um_filter_60_75]PJC19637.1 MAG: formate hydrogenlyase [Comamonadaceae bacterium CG_4_9_14_0_8_um_filter_60_18]
MDSELSFWALAVTQTLLFVAAAPLLAGWVQRVKCHLQNRAAPAVWQPYRDLAKLLGKQMVIAHNASWLFRATPYIVFGAMLLACTVVPLIVVHVPTAAIADVIVLVGFFSLARFFTALAGLDIGTAFGGMGASREMMVAALAEPAMLMVVFTFSMTAHTTNLSVATAYILNQGLLLRPSFLFALLALAMVAVAEASRIPVDNPATHLELTMLHEAMILEYGGRHLALIEWASQIKLMIYAVLLINFTFPWGIASEPTMTALATGLVVVTAKLMLIGVVLVVWETVMAKMRLFRVPQFLGFAFMLAVLGMLTHVMLEGGN